MARTVLVTEGSSGIGRATVRRVAQEGERVWFTYRTGHDRALATTMLEASTLAGLAPEQRRAWEARLPQRRLIQPAEIADVVWWLAGAAAPVLPRAVLDASMSLGVHPGLLTGDLLTGADAGEAG